TGEFHDDRPPVDFFCPEIIAAELHHKVWFDLRGFYRNQRNAPKVRDFDSERLRLVAGLHERSANSIEPLWHPESQRVARLRCAIASTVAVGLVLIGSVAIWQTQSRQQQQALKEIAEALGQVYSDPFSAIAHAYNANATKRSEQTAEAIERV